jgi:hypothetical protein
MESLAYHGAELLHANSGAPHAVRWTLGSLVAAMPLAHWMLCTGRDVDTPDAYITHRYALTSRPWRLIQSFPPSQMLRAWSRRPSTTRLSLSIISVISPHSNLRRNATMSADATMSKREQAARLAAERAKAAQEKIRADPKAKRGAPAYFPLGYKEAAYQWVSDPDRRTNTFCL